MRDDRRLFLVCYDISDDGRRRSIYKTLRGYGEHLQYSVFRCVLDRRRLVELRFLLEEVVVPSKDQVIFVPLGLAENAESWRVLVIGMPVPLPERIARVIG